MCRASTITYATVEAYAAINGPEPPLAAVLLYDLEQAAAMKASGAATMMTTTTRLSLDGGRSRGAAGPPSGAIAVKHDGGASRDRRELRVALVGAGGFATGVHLPNLRADPHVQIPAVVTRSASTAGDAARLAPGAIPMTDWHTPLADPEIDLIVIGTRHDTHAEIAVAALGAGKAVLVEKPLGLTRAQIDSVWRACAAHPHRSRHIFRGRLPQCDHRGMTFTRESQGKKTDFILSGQITNLQQSRGTTAFGVSHRCGGSMPREAQVRG